MTIEVCRCTRRRELTRLHFTSKWKGPFSLQAFLFTVIIKTTIPLIMIGLKNSCFPIILLTSCYQTVCYRTVQEANHIQRCSLNQLNQFFFQVLFSTTRFTSTLGCEDLSNSFLQCKYLNFIYLKSLFITWMIYLDPTY